MSTRRRVKEIGGGSSYRAWKEWAEGDAIEGELMSVGTDKYDNPSYKLKVSACGWDESLVGKNFTLNSAGSLNTKMDEVEVGQVVYVEYEGIITLEKGKYKGKECHSIMCGIVNEDADEMADAGAEDL